MPETVQALVVLRENRDLFLRSAVEVDESTEEIVRGPDCVPHMRARALYVNGEEIIER